MAFRWVRTALSIAVSDCANVAKHTTKMIATIPEMLFSLIGNITSTCDDLPVRIRPPIAEKLPCVPNFLDLVHIEIGDNKLVLIS